MVLDGLVVVMGCLWRVLWLPWGAASHEDLLESIYPLRPGALMKGFFITLALSRGGS